MARQKRNTVPTSVILTHEQKTFIKKFGEKEGRSYSSMLRFIVIQWVNYQLNKENAHGEEAKEADAKAQAGRV